jgi:hypothetical protein
MLTARGAYSRAVGRPLVMRWRDDHSQHERAATAGLHLQGRVFPTERHISRGRAPHWAATPAARPDQCGLPPKPLSGRRADTCGAGARNPPESARPVLAPPRLTAGCPLGRAGFFHLHGAAGQAVGGIETADTLDADQLANPINLDVDHRHARCSAIKEHPMNPDLLRRVGGAFTPRLACRTGTRSPHQPARGGADGRLENFPASSACVLPPHP